MEGQVNRSVLFLIEEMTKAICCFPIINRWLASTPTRQKVSSSKHFLTINAIMDFAMSTIIRMKGKQAITPIRNVTYTNDNNCKVHFSRTFHIHFSSDKHHVTFVKIHSCHFNLYFPFYAQRNLLRVKIKTDCSLALTFFLHKL